MRDVRVTTRIQEKSGDAMEHVSNLAFWRPKANTKIAKYLMLEPD